MDTPEQPPPTSASIAVCMYAVVSGSRAGPSQILRKLLLAISVCSAAIPNTFAKSLTEVLSAVRGHFSSNDGSDNFCYYSCYCIDLSRVSPAVIYLVCLYSMKKCFHYGRIAFTCSRNIVLSAWWCPITDELLYCQTFGTYSDPPPGRT